MPATSSLRPGDPERLGRYRLTGLLGEGGQGSVFLAAAADGPPDERVAVKLLHARFSGDARARSRFAAEVAVARRVAPFCTARIVDADVDGDRPYIVSEFIDGPSLLEVLRMRGPRSGPELDRLAIGTMTALTAIHEAGIVHRDFKPGNILLAHDGPRVIDFGIARALDATGTLSSTAVGTPAYMAPEQISGAAVGPAADVFAWGATMVYAASGRPAFGQDSIPAVMHRILNLPPDLGLMTGPLRDVVADCLAKDPARRPASRDVLLRLLSLAGGAPAPGGRPADVLGQGAAAASTYTGAGTHTSHDAATPAPHGAGTAHDAATTHSAGAQAHGAAGAHGGAQGRPGAVAAPPLPPWGGPGAPQPWATVPAGQPARPGRRRGIAVLAGGGGAAVVAVAVAAVLLLPHGGGPGISASTGAGSVGGTLTVSASALESSVGAIDPAADLGGPTERTITKSLFTGLTEIAPDGKLLNRMATSLTPNGDCTHWTIAVRSGTTFSDGEPVDAAAFARGWSRTAQNPNGGASFVMRGIKGYDEVSTGKADTLTGVTADGSTLQVDLQSPECDFPLRVAGLPFVPAPKNAGRYNDTSYRVNPVGNGPFKLAGTSSSAITLVRNKAWAFGSTPLDKVTLKLSEDATRAGMSGLASGTLGFSPLSSSAQGTTGTRLTRTIPGSRFLLPLTARGPMADRNARLAVSYALDRRQAVAAAGPGYAAATGIVPAATPGYGNPGVCPSCARQDVAKAVQLATDAKLPSGSTVRLYTMNFPSQRNLAEVVQSQLRQVLGWNVEIKSYDRYPALAKAVSAGDASGLVLYAWTADVPTAELLLGPLLGDPAVYGDDGLGNFGRWRDGPFDTLLAEVARTPDASRRLDLARQAEKIAADALAIVPLVDIGVGAAYDPQYTGLRLDLDGDPTLATAALK
ncbi:Serine/threonine-protein kinase AfsK [Actinomadura rubteroloni]|uniref:Serine/threonine-protein kinase AfsK n=1 Tax=Actinomadura rubteroloni TaxID=1926885 RepID=A0A2P4UCT5_9ACTN|nr:ABC transporter substrate-binding protein [Actinomadura rubteroloni]POM22863.1 Serine/threonine-protein kinase AfsK [Actinomadura rubteroloni]